MVKGNENEVEIMERGNEEWKFIDADNWNTRTKK